MFHITRLVLAVSAVAAGLAGARADDRVFTGDRFAPSGGGAFLSDALYPEMPGTNAPIERRIGTNASAPPGVVAPAALPFLPHFGFSTGDRGTSVDGVFFSPAEGIELTAKPVLGDGFRGVLGVTVRF